MDGGGLRRAKPGSAAAPSAAGGRMRRPRRSAVPLALSSCLGLASFPSDAPHTRVVLLHRNMLCSTFKLNFNFAGILSAKAEGYAILLLYFGRDDRSSLSIAGDCYDAKRKE